jgi:hypothetical protein
VMLCSLWDCSQSRFGFSFWGPCFTAEDSCLFVWCCVVCEIVPSPDEAFISVVIAQFFCTEDIDSKYLCSVGYNLPGCTALRPTTHTA